MSMNWPFQNFWIMTGAALGCRPTNSQKICSPLNLLYTMTMNWLFQNFCDDRSCAGAFSTSTDSQNICLLLNLLCTTTMNWRFQNFWIMTGAALERSGAALSVMNVVLAGEDESCLCNTLQHTATLQHTLWWTFWLLLRTSHVSATHCNTLQHTLSWRLCLLVWGGYD